MSKFTRFMKANKATKENEKYAPTASLIDENKNPLEWEFRHITSAENEELRDSCTLDIQITGKPGMYRQKLNASQYVKRLIVASTVFPDLYDKELQDSYGVMTPEELVLAMVDDPGEYQDFGLWVQKFQGFDTTREDRVKEAKN